MAHTCGQLLACVHRPDLIVAIRLPSLQAGVGRPEVTLGPETWHLVAPNGSDAAEYDATAADTLPEPAVRFPVLSSSF